MEVSTKVAACDRDAEHEDALLPRFLRASRAHAHEAKMKIVPRRSEGLLD
jgi:hypothetical protein